MHKKRLKIDLFRSNSNTKGQITIFIILGLLLLLTVALIIAFQKEIISFGADELIPTEKGKVENFIVTCIDSVADEALFKIGLQGGYVDLPLDLATDSGVSLRTSTFTSIPYWAYGEQTNIPSLDQIKRRIDAHIESNLRSCLFGTEAFQETYDLFEKNSISSDITIADRGIIYNVNWNVEIRDKIGNVVAELLTHSTESPIKLKKLHETAEQIINVELRDLKLEDLTQDLIALEHPDVPVAGLEVSCSQKRWKVEDVKQTLKDLLRVNLRELKVSGTQFVDFPEELPYYQNHYVWNVGEDFQVEDVSVQFQFEDHFPFSFDVRPRQGTYLRSNQLGGENELLSVLCMQTWKFVYDVTYPVVVTLHDETTGYDFKMSFTVHLQRNLPDRTQSAITPRPIFFDTYSDEAYCQERTVPMSVYTEELIENNEGVYFAEPLDNVDLTYTCLRYRCDIGQTEYNFAGMGDISAIRTNFPYCAGGIVRGDKEGYKEAWERVVTEPDKETTLSLVPLFSFPLENVNIVKHELLANGLLGSASSLSNEDTAIITLTYNKRDQVLGEPFHKSTAVWSRSLDSEVLKDEKLDFLARADFTYTLSIDVLDETEFIGGSRNNWTVSWDELQSGQDITFHVVSQDSPSEEETFELLIGLESGSISAPLPEIR